MMPRLPEVDTLATGLADRIAKASPSADALWQVLGPPTSGKTSLLRSVSGLLLQKQLIPIHVGPPNGALDAGPIALLQIGASLKEKGLVNGQLETLTKPDRSWVDKLRDVQTWLENASDRVVLMVDEPQSWYARSPEDVHFADHTDSVVKAFVGFLRCRRLVVGDLPDGARAAKTYLRPSSDPESWLLDRDAWGELSAAARSVWEAFGSRLEQMSPLHVRLLVALAAITSNAKVPTFASRRDTARSLAMALSERSELQSLRETWARLALIRRPFQPRLLESLVTPKLGKLATEILNRCLLYQVDAGLVLHDTLRADAREHSQWLDKTSTRGTHRVLAEYYKSLFSNTASDSHQYGRALLAEMEAFHHASLVGDASYMDGFAPFFVEQLDVLGRVLSRDYKKYDAAAQVFARALEWDDNDDYAHHYRAFNLDIVGKDPEAAEQHYRRAVELRPNNEWWWSRFINLLVTLGQTREAKKAWHEALDSFGLPNEDVDARVYEELHVWVARLLLHRGQLDFAREVLQGIPASVKQTNPGFSALERRLTTLLDAKTNGAVFPITIPPERWWSGPHLNAKHNRDGRRLVSWLPGRVESLDGDNVVLFVATPPQLPNGAPVYGHLNVPFGRFDRWTRDERATELAAGRFVEVAFYGAGKNAPVIVRVHREIKWEDPDLPPLFPDPTRYL